MNDPVRVEPHRLADFVNGSGPVVLFVSAHSKHRFNRSLCKAFGDGGEDVAFGHASLSALMSARAPALNFLRTHVRGLGIDAPVVLPPGYYLFRDGRLLAWHLGLPLPDDVSRVICASMLGAGVAILMRNLRFLGVVIGYAAEDAAAERTATHFRDAAAAADSQRATPDMPHDELDKAYRTLGIKPTASDAELVRAWRAMQRQYHPDRAGPDVAEAERRSRRCAEINRARDLIRRHRRSKASPQ
jgi:hypothetical protein